MASTLLAGGVGCLVATAADAATITTTYEYNADGALTATTTQTDDGAESTTYFTWDNFVPDVARPSLGTVRPGNGNLVSTGPAPDGGASAQRLRYDSRNRLVGCQTGGSPEVTYEYDASNLLTSMTLSTGDQLRLYHGGAALLTNQRQPATAATSGFLGPVRYLGDGAEQTMLRPRKDVAGAYEAASEQLTTYTTEPYGAPRSGRAPNDGLTPDASQFDLSYNSQQFAGEYRDPVCDAYYLRARWYLPTQQMFVSRDPVDPVHRYGYGGGNPVNRADPSGLSYRAYKRGVDRFMKKLDVGAAVLSALPWVGPAMALVQASAVGEFWHDKNAAATLGYMALWAGAGVVLELPAFERVSGAVNAFRGRIGADAFVAVAQSAQASLDGKGGRFDTALFGENVGLAAATILTGRVGAGIGYKPYSLDRTEVEEMVQEHYVHSRSGSDQRVLVFVEQTKKAGSRGTWTTPWMEKTNLGYYRARVIGLETDDPFTGMVHESELSSLPGEMSGHDVYARAGRYSRLDRAPESELTGQYRFVGSFHRSDVEDAFRSNPLGLTSVGRQWRAYLETGTTLPSGFDPLRSNCQTHAAGVVETLQSLAAERGD